MVCWQPLDDGSEDVVFADYTPLPEGWMGQAQGMEFFCSEHLAAAQALSHLTWPEAETELEKEFGVFPKPWEQPDYGKPPHRSFFGKIKDFWDDVLGR